MSSSTLHPTAEAQELRRRCKEIQLTEKFHKSHTTLDTEVTFFDDDWSYQDKTSSPFANDGVLNDESETQRLLRDLDEEFKKILSLCDETTLPASARKPAKESGTVTAIWTIARWLIPFNTLKRDTNVTIKTTNS